MAYFSDQRPWAKPGSLLESTQSASIPKSSGFPHIQEQPESQPADRSAYVPSDPSSSVRRHYSLSEYISSGSTGQNDSRSSGKMKSNAGSVHLPQIPQSAQLPSSHIQPSRHPFQQEDFYTNHNTGTPAISRFVSNASSTNAPKSRFLWEASISEISADDQDNEDAESQVSTVPTLLGAAIRQGLSRASMLTAQRQCSSAPINPDHSDSTETSFTTAPERSPASVYTNCSIPDDNHDTVPVSVFAYRQTQPGNDLFTSHLSQPSDSEAREPNPTLRALPLRNFWTPQSLKSSDSCNPIPVLGIESTGMSGKISPDKRPANLNMEAVRDMESRGSTTSLAELIRRATRLATNLDRGKTASRFRFDTLSDDEKALQPNRESTYSDVLAAFPSPALGNTPPDGRSRAMRQRKHIRSRSSSNQDDHPSRKVRQCCGISLRAFVMFTTMIILLVAAAVLAPTFLILIPKQNPIPSGIKDCARSFPCQNGVSLIVNNLCSCVCTNGYTGSQCYTATDPECTTSTVADGSNTYSNATVGDSILPVLSTGPEGFGISLNASVLLSTFARNNLSCASENSLVDFDFTTGTNQKRSIVAREMRTTAYKVTFAPIASKPRNTKRLLTFNDLNLDYVKSAALPAPSQTAPVVSSKLAEMLKVRQTSEGTLSTNNIVYASSTTTNPQATNVQSLASSGASSSTTTSHTATMTSSYTTQQLDFARVVVLYVLEESEAISLAVSANQAFERYFRAGGITSGNNTVQFPGVNGTVTADFAHFTINTPNGQTIGRAIS